MKTLLTLLWFFPLLAFAGDRISEAKIREVFADDLRAEESLEMDTFTKNMAVDVKIKVGDPDTKEVSLLYDGREAYQAMLNRAYSTVSKYSLEMGPLDIDISADGQSATVKHDQVEHWTIDGIITTANTLQIYKFVLVGEKVVIKEWTIWPVKQK